MDTTDPQIAFDSDGVCNHCTTYAERASKELHYDEAGQEQLTRIVNQIKKDGESKSHDCILGVSGGIDSTFLAYTVHRLGLRPLAVHLDNGWDSELSLSNIYNLAENLGLDLYVSRVDWAEFRQLQRSFLESSISNAEIPTDHAIVAFLYRVALKARVRYIISGGNITTEAVVPASWGYEARDWTLVKSISRRFGGTVPSHYCHLSLLDWVYCTFIKGIKYVPILNYVPYYREEAEGVIREKCGWQDYGGKHNESVYTRFFQGYIQPVKFGFDKRRVHLSNLVWSGQLSRDAALEEMSKGPYASGELLTSDRKQVLQKLELTDEGFEGIMAKPVKAFSEYPNEHNVYARLELFAKLARRIATTT